MKIKNILLIIGVFVFSGHVLGQDAFKINMQIFHMDKLIAQPEMSVVNGKTAKASISLPDQVAYQYSVLVTSSVENKVNVSIQFVSGELKFTPELKGVDIGKETSATINDFKLKLLIE